MREVRGRAAVHAKGEWWVANHDVHSFETSGPYVNGDQFALRFKIDVTPKATGQRTQMDEVGLYTVRDGRIAEERFFLILPATPRREEAWPGAIAGDVPAGRQDRVPRVIRRCSS